MGRGVVPARTPAGGEVPGGSLTVVPDLPWGHLLTRSREVPGGLAGKIDHAADTAAGAAAQKKVGEATNNRDLQAEGQEQQSTGPPQPLRPTPNTADIGSAGAPSCCQVGVTRPSSPRGPPRCTGHRGEVRPATAGAGRLRTPRQISRVG
ncbi:hypothetical protein GCM10011374_38890 [Kocuria dechangensis]|uniref:Uncharacterized protein n=1 Tax=Kocuria dechangensis TaxID=1176249 RepID=A0A917H838_9MICC|nr:hypothetical protein GCM10011374_38890 [Kocuria dechangensis]